MSKLRSAEEILQQRRSLHRALKQQAQSTVSRPSHTSYRARMLRASVCPATPYGPGSTPSPYLVEQYLNETLRKRRQFATDKRLELITTSQLTENMLRSMPYNSTFLPVSLPLMCNPFFLNNLQENLCRNTARSPVEMKPEVHIEAESLDVIDGPKSAFTPVHTVRSHPNICISNRSATINSTGEVRKTGFTILDILS